MHPTQTAPRPTLPRGLVVAAVVGAVWRCWVLFVDKWDRPLLFNDSLYYSAQARQLAHGTFFREIFVDQPGAEHGPLTPLLMAPVSWMHDPVPWQRMVTVCCGIATIVVIGLVAGRLAGPRAAVCAGWIAAVYPNLWMNDGLVMSESISVLLVALFLLRMEAAAREWSVRSAALVGLIVGLATLARSELVLLAPAAAVVLFFVDRPENESPTEPPRMLRAGVLLAIAALTVAPWVAFNLVRFERPVTLSTNDGTTLLGAYCDDTFSGPEVGGWYVFCVTEGDPDYATDEEPSVRSARQRSLAITYAREHVGELPRVIAARVGRTLDLYGLHSLVKQDVGEERARWASWAGIVAWWVLAVAALAGIGRVRALSRWILFLPVLSVLVTTIVFYGGHRIRSSMEPTVVVLAAIALSGLAARIGRSRAAPDDVVVVGA
jgi:Dolichyl-phosphate-mannose-protein mannosyltransferase